MSANFNSSKILDQSLLKDHFSFTLRSNSSAKRDFSESVQAALRSGLNPKDLQTILDSILNSAESAKEVQ